jgi:hypothetical protein
MFNCCVSGVDQRQREPPAVINDVRRRQDQGHQRQRPRVRADLLQRPNPSECRFQSGHVPGEPFV